MTDDFNPGQFVILGFDGTKPDAGTLALIEKYRPAGFLLLERNYESPQQLKSLINELRIISGHLSLIAVDQEPGRVQRFKKRFPASKQPSDYIKGNKIDEFRSWCSDTASLLRESGVNLNLAPVLDMMPEPVTNPVLSQRVFGGDPDTISEFADVLIKEHQQNRVLTCGKHFPGLGSAILDPHIELSVSDDPSERFAEYHWLPFEKASSKGVDFIMTTHLKARSIDPENAATHSTKTVKMLRDRLHFAGPVISDDLAMAGAADSRTLGVSAVKAVEAGHNLVIISRDTDNQLEALEYMKKRYTQDEKFANIANHNEIFLRQFSTKTLSKISEI